MCQAKTVKAKQICGMNSTLSLGCVIRVQFAACSAIWEGLDS